MQIAKKGLFWIFISILILPSVSAVAFPTTQELLSYYREYYGFIDFFLAFMLFTSLTRLFVEKKFGEDSPATKPLYISLGLILSVALVTWEVQSGFSLFNLGPVPLLLFLVFIAVAIYHLLRHKGEGKETKLDLMQILFGIAVILLALILFFPELVAYIPLADLDTLVGIAVVVVFLVIIYLIINWIRGKRGKGEGGVGGKPEVSRSPSPSREETRGPFPPEVQIKVLEVCDISGELPSQFCTKTHKEEFSIAKAPKNTCSKCKPEKVKVSIMIRDEKGNRNKKNEFMQGAKLIVTAFLDSKIISIRDVKLYWVNEDHETKRFIIGTGKGSGFFAGDRDVQEIDTATLPALKPGQSKKIDITLIASNPRTGNALASIKETCTLLAPLLILEPELIIVDKTGREARDKASAPIIIIPATQIKAIPNAKLAVMGGNRYNWLASQLDASNNEVGAKLPIYSGSALTNITPAMLVSAGISYGIYFIYCFVTDSSGNELKNAHGNTVWDRIKIEITTAPQGPPPPPIPTGDPEINRLKKLIEYQEIIIKYMIDGANKKDKAFVEKTTIEFEKFEDTINTLTVKIEARLKLPPETTEYIKGKSHGGHYDMQLWGCNRIRAFLADKKGPQWDNIRTILEKTLMDPKSGIFTKRKEDASRL